MCLSESIIKLLNEAKREHYHCDDNWYCCGMCLHPDHCLDEDDFLDSHGGHNARTSGVCNCGAEAWNKKLKKRCDDERFRWNRNQR